MADVFVYALLLLFFVIVAFVCILVAVAALYIAHVHRKYSHLPGPPYHRYYEPAYVKNHRPHRRSYEKTKGPMHRLG